MLSERLPIALERGLVTLPQTGRIAVFGARVSDDLDALPKDRVQVITRHFPDHAHFQAQGYDVTTGATGSFSLGIVVLPRAKDEARDLIAVAAQHTDGALVLDGQKTDGIDSLIKELRKRAEVGETLSKAHGKIVAIHNADCVDWLATSDPLIEGRFQTGPGVFSADGIDPGSEILAALLPTALKGRVVDLGAGWGYLSDAILKREGVDALELVEADHAALSAAREHCRSARLVSLGGRADLSARTGG